MPVRLGKSDVAAVVVTYNRKKLLRENIAALAGQNDAPSFDIIVVDNASTDGTRVMVEALSQEYEAEGRALLYENTGANLGGAGGFQYGIRLAAEQGYAFIWLMDDDCIPEPEALANLWQADCRLNGNHGWLSSQVRWRDGSICAMNVQRRTLTCNVSDFSSPFVPCVMASFVSLFLRVERVREMGLPIKEFFIWTDDWEYTRRISRRYPCYLVNGSRVVHKSDSNIPANLAADAPERLSRYRYLYRNDVYLYRREGLVGFCYEVARLGWHILRILLHARDLRWERLEALLSGTKAGFSFCPSIEFLGCSEVIPKELGEDDQ